MVSVHYEMPRSNHIHKSMLLRGIKLPAKALDQSDIEGTRSRAARSGRSHGGVPLYGNGGSRGRDSFNYSGSNSFSRPQNYGQQSYGGHSDYNNHNYAPAQPSSWQPPPPGVPGFARGPPPPPPSSYGAQPYAHSRQAQPQPPTYSTQNQPPMPQFGYDAAYDHRNYGDGRPNYGPPPGYGRY
jgi:5'-3' exoribonuclease 2